ncbi:MAG: hypothetical protein MUE51_01855 [Thermoleophilia bacterium]|jgi:hypothetical protein|nr:hypothetical protein [Thermoleophilia bacterium]
MSDPALHCSACGGSDLTPLAARDGGVQLRFEPRRKKFMGWLPTFNAYYGRACYDCGNLMMFFQGEHLQKMRDDRDEYTGVEVG